jgi:signal transduction histidine kinase
MMIIRASENQSYLHSFMMTAQYLASLTTHEDVWRHIGEVMVGFYGAELAGFVRHGPDADLTFHHLILPAGFPQDVLKTKETQETVKEVLETGFLTWSVLLQLGEPFTLVFLPVSLGKETTEVMLVGHYNAGSISHELLNVYLAVAGLAGTTITKLASETELKARAKRLEFLNQELQEFAFVASHDLQEPLRKIQAFGNLLEVSCRDSLSDQGRDYLMRMSKSANRMSALLDDLLGYSQVATRHEPLVLADLSEIVREAVSDLELAVARVEGCVEIGPLPAVEVYPNLMRQLFQNLISNSLKYRRDEDRPKIRIHGEARDKTFSIYVEDNGFGFDEAYLDRIFKPFQRLHGRSEYEGTGMGLAICRKIVERHGGSITATSTPGQGSIFVVTLPAKEGRIGDG